MVWRADSYIQAIFNLPTNSNQSKINYDVFMNFYYFESVH